MVGVGKLKRAMHEHGVLYRNHQTCHSLNLMSVKHQYLKSIKIKICIENNEAFITLHSTNTKQSIKFLIDSGASLSFISANLIKNGAIVDYTNTVNVTSATGHSTKTIATINDIIHVDGTDLRHEFHIFNQNIPINADGILGMDFFVKFKCVLNVSTSTFTFSTPVSTECVENAFSAD